MRLPYPTLCDPDRAAYTTFGLLHGTRESVWSWDTAGAYLRGLARGQLPRRPEGDVRQLGGDVVLDRDGRVVYLYRGTTPADRPPVADVIAALRQAAGRE